MDTVVTYLILSFIVSFLLGSIPWGVIISKLAFKKDLRDEGSGNIGTTNAMRTLGKAGGAAVFALDFGKGLLSGWLAAYVFAPAVAGVPMDIAAADGELLLGISSNPTLNPVALCMALAFAGCALGHIFSPWLKFHGGKGIAVAAACLLFVYGPVAPSPPRWYARFWASTSTGAIGWRGSLSWPRRWWSSGLTALTSAACAPAPRTASAARRRSHNKIFNHGRRRGNTGCSDRASSAATETGLNVLFHKARTV